MLKHYSKFFNEVVDIWEKYDYDKQKNIYVLRRKNKYNIYEIVDYNFSANNFQQALKYFKNNKVLDDDVIFKFPLSCFIIELFHAKIENKTNTIQLIETTNIYHDKILTIKFFTDETDIKNKVDFMFVDRLKKP